MTALHTYTPFDIYNQFKSLSGCTAELCKRPSETILAQTIDSFVELQKRIKVTPFASTFERAIFELAKRIKHLQDTTKKCSKEGIAKANKSIVEKALINIKLSVAAIFNVYQTKIHDAPSDAQKTKLHILFTNRNALNSLPKIEQLLNSHGINKNYIYFHGKTLLQQSIVEYDVEAVNFFIKIGADVNYSLNDNILPPLFLACSLYSQEMTKLNIDVTTYLHQSLHQAGLTNSLTNGSFLTPVLSLRKIITDLLKAGANPFLDGKILGKGEEIYKLEKALIELNPDKFFLGDLLKKAQQEGNEERIQFLLQRGAPIFAEVLKYAVSDILERDDPEKDRRTIKAKYFRQLYLDQTCSIRSQLLQTKGLLQFPQDLIETMISYIPCAVTKGTAPSKTKKTQKMIVL